MNRMAIDRFSILLLTKIVFLVVSVRGFSYNINARRTFRPRDGVSNDHSYFGYSLLLRDGVNPMIIVGAPQDTSRFGKHAGIKDPGAIYYCMISKNSTEDTCTQKILDPEGNTKHTMVNGKSYHHRKEGMWLGMSMDGTALNNGTVVMCAPRWINQYHQNYYLGNGICYSVPDTLRPFEVSNTAMLMPLIDQANQGFFVNNADSHKLYGTHIYYYAYGQAGISTKLSDSNLELLIGAPGALVWRGTVIRYKITKQQNGDYFIRQPVPNPFYTSEIKDDAYFGYSVGFGKFSSKRNTLYVAGAPRGSDLKGDVIIFDFPSRSVSKYVILAKFEGKKIGEYFGSVIATIDIDQDGLTDLLIGAPLHSQSFTWDQGRVYVFMNQDNFQFKEQEAPICGSFREGGRFGSAISAIGDINDDGFIDVAIGSPYEDYGRGAVYIYLGSKDGLNPYYTQRIVIDNTEGFGISISKGIDIDKNSCNDIAVGAYVSRKVILLRCHPSVHVIPRIETIPKELTLNATSFTAQVCLQFVGKKSFITDIEARLFVDMYYKRASIETNSDKTIVISGKGETETCQDIFVDIESELADFSRPIELKMIYGLKNNPMREAEFCANCTVLRPTEKSELTYQVPFASGCANLICQPDLIIRVDFLTKSPYIIGSSKNFSINITLENVGEPAFVAKTKLYMNQKLPILKVPSRCDLAENNELICNFENLVFNQSKEYIVLEFDSSSLVSTDRMIEFNITSYSGGEEVTPDDNDFFEQFPLKASSKVDVLGTTVENQFIYVDKNMELDSSTTIAHFYDILNDGPTIVELFEMMFYVPIEFYDTATDKKLKLVDVYEPEGYMNGQPLICNPVEADFYEMKKEGHGVDFTNDTTEDYLSTTENTVDSSSTESTSEYFSQTTEDDVKISEINNNYFHDLNFTTYSRSIYLNCTNKDMVNCMRIRCRAKDLNVGSNGAHISFKMRVNVSNFDMILKDKHIAILSTLAKVEPLQDGVDWKSFGFVNSYFISVELRPAPVSIWIYILAFILGILLLAVLVYIFYKFGFFRRKTKEELELLKDQDYSNSTETLE